MYDTTQKMEMERHGTIRNDGGISQFNTISEHLNVSHDPKTGCRAILHGSKTRRQKPNQSSLWESLCRARSEMGNRTALQDSK